MDQSQSRTAPHLQLSSPVVYALYLAGGATMLFPAVYFLYPLSADYLLHLARIHIIFAPGNAFFARVFETNFDLVPNLALDVFAFAARSLGIDANRFLKGFFVISVAGMWLGIVECHRAVHGGVRPSALLLLPILYSFVVSVGLLDFIFGMAVFFATFAWVIRRRPKPYVSIAIVNLVALVVFFSHFGAFLIMAVSLFLYRIGDGQRPRRALLVSAAENTLPFIVYLSMPPLTGDLFRFTSLHTKLTEYFALFYMGSMTFAVIIALLYAAVMALLYKSGALEWNTRWVPLVTGLGILALIAPGDYKASYLIDARLLWAAAIFFVLSVDIRTERFWVEPAVIGLVAAVLFINVSHLVQVTRVYNKEVAEFRQAITAIPMNSFVFVSTADKARCARNEQTSDIDVDRNFRNWMISFLTIDRDSVQPHIAANRGVTAVHFRKAFEQYAAFPPQGPADRLLAALLAIGSPVPLTWKGDRLYSGSDLAIRPFMDKWNERFGYVVDMTHGCSGPGPYAGIFEPIAKGSFFEIFATGQGPEKLGPAGSGGQPNDFDAGAGVGK